MFKGKHSSFNSFITVTQKTYLSFPSDLPKLTLKKPHTSLFTGLHRKKTKHTNSAIPRKFVLGARSRLGRSVIYVTVKLETNYLPI